MTRNHPTIRKTASNADLYSDPSPPRPLRHSYSTLSRSHTTASVAYRPRVLERNGGIRDAQYDFRNRHSIAAPYPSLIDIDDQDEYDYPKPSRHQNPPPVPPKIPEAPAPLVKHDKPKEPRLAPSHSWHPVPTPIRAKVGPEKYTKPFTDFMTGNPTVFHAIDAVAKDLEKDGYKKLSERDTWDLKAGGKVCTSVAIPWRL